MLKVSRTLNFFEDDEALFEWENQQLNLMEAMGVLDFDPDHVDPWRVAQAFNVHYSVVEELVKLGMPKQADNTFSLDDVMHWIEENRVLFEAAVQPKPARSTG